MEGTPEVLSIPGLPGLEPNPDFDPRAAVPSTRMAAMREARGEYELDTDPARLVPAVVHAYLTESYWSPGVTPDVVERAMAYSLCFGLYRGDEQVGFARVVTDRASFAWLADVFVLPEHRGRGLGEWLVRAAAGHADLAGVRRFVLATRDAHGLYARFGFEPFDEAEARRWMVRRGDA